MTEATKQNDTPFYQLLDYCQKKNVKLHVVLRNGATYDGFPSVSGQDSGWIKLTTPDRSDGSLDLVPHLIRLSEIVVCTW